MSATGSRHGFALIADVVGSMKTADFVSGRDRRLARLSDAHRERGWMRARYTVTAWDEFQSFGWKVEAIPHLILELRQYFAPWELRVGIGLGQIRGWRSRRPINEAVTGAAFERAREALDALQAPGEKYRRLTRFRTGTDSRDALLDLIYGLHDTLVQGVTERQWESIGRALAGQSQEEIAAALRVQPSTVSRNLRRGHYWQMRETAQGVSAWLD